jgi:hypothetical protein
MVSLLQVLVVAAVVARSTHGFGGTRWSVNMGRLLATSRRSTTETAEPTTSTATMGGYTPKVPATAVRCHVFLSVCTNAFVPCALDVTLWVHPSFLLPSLTVAVAQAVAVPG